ncbi:MAG: hypothetical protein K8W52_04675 [Deltaproteobacteria bacterium]|nr:hypothetical protein [Deltaproteobacteria bacterium]
MSYRNDVDAARARTEVLGRELAELEARLGDRAAIEARILAVRAELSTAEAQVAHGRARVALPLLDRVVIKTPCKESWAAMRGDDRKRFCGKCDKHVYDLSAMTAVEAEALLAGPGEAPCLRLYRRPDGTVLTSDCPIGSRRRRRNRWAIVGVAVAAVASLLGFATRSQRGAVQGGMAPMSGDPSDSSMGGSGMSSPPPAQMGAATGSGSGSGSATR